MAFEIINSLRSFVSGFNALGPPRYQFYFVSINSSGQLYRTTQGGMAIGVLQDTPRAAEPGGVCGPGSVTKVMCGGAFNAGDYVISDSQGRAVKATSGANFLGQALSAGVLGYLADIIYQPSDIATP